MKKTAIFIFLLIIVASFGCATYKKNPSKFYRKYPFTVNFVFDDIVKDSSLSSLLNMSFIKDTKMSNVNLVRLNGENSKTIINPANQSNSKLGIDFTAKAKINDACKEAKNYLSSKEGKYSLYVYANQMKQNCPIDGSKSYTDLNNLNQAVINEVSMINDKKNLPSIYIYVPTFTPLPPAPICDSIKNPEILFENYSDTLYGIDDFDRSLFYLYPVKNYAYYYLVCDTICGADNFKITIKNEGKSKETIIYSKDFFTYEKNIYGKTVGQNYYGKYVFPIQNSEDIKGNEKEEVKLKIESINSIGKIPHSKFQPKEYKIIFTGCPKQN